MRREWASPSDTYSDDRCCSDLTALTHCNPNLHAEAYADTPDPYIHCHPHAADANTHTGATDCHSHARAANSYAYACAANANAHTGATDCHGHADPDSNADSDCHSHADRHADRHANTQAHHIRAIWNDRGDRKPASAGA